MQPFPSKNSKTLFAGNRKGVNILIRALIILGAYGTLYLQIFRKHRLDELVSAFGGDTDLRGMAWVLPLVVVLMVMNWSTETWKWQVLIRKVERLRFMKAFNAVLAGITVSMFTPNRVGEYFGRIFVLREDHRWEGVFITIIGSISQLIVTLFAGIPAFWLFLHRQGPVQDDRIMALLDISLAGLSIIAILLLGLFLNIAFITRWTKRLIRDEWVRLRRYMEVFGYYHRADLLPVLFMSLLRYIVFSLQFLIILSAFGIHLDPGEAFVAIPSIFLITTVYPSFTLAELGLRGSATSFVLLPFITGTDTGHLLAMMAAAGSLWVINLVLPALAGTFIIARMNFLKRRNAG